MNSFRTAWHCVFRTSPQKVPESRFVDLAPTSDADETGIYRAALEYATSNDDVLNIALTGPYGSGKSSVIKSFLLRYPKLPLQLSLASFLPDGDLPGVRVSKQEIERSILQQILYGADADKLPLSRFKRIQTPSKWSALNSLWVSLGILCVWYLWDKQSDVLSGNFFRPLELSNWFNYLSSTVAALFLWKMVHAIYLKSFGLSLKSISLKEVQIAPDTASEESILNRHLDEIIYFFQSTSYDLVVIEDLDRFENPDIFVTLREINGLINANAGINRRIRFLYALRDDIFINTDRTKFFEFIVPVIPVINHSNSVDKVLEHSQRMALDGRLDRQFIRDVSRYLNDLRLIRNIFNEYVIYSANLKADDDELDPNKLLAILIYKNVMPKDFAALHRQDGALSKVLSSYDEYVAKIERGLHEELSDIEADLARGDAQFLKDLSELRKIYAMSIIARIPPGYSTVITSTGQIGLGQFPEHPEFDNILAQGSMSVTNSNGYHPTVNFKDVEAAVDSRTFAERKADFDRKSIKYKQTAEKKSRGIKQQLASLRTRKFNEVVRESADLIEEIFAEVGESRELLRFLILEGYLDDTYYQYISLFHSGRLSPSDNKFLIQIRSYSIPGPDFQIDNAAEVVAAMRVEDFAQRYVLNRFVVDHLFEARAANSSRIASMCEFMAAHFADCEDFFASYYGRGTQVGRLVHTLASRWPAFPVTALDGAQSASHAARILAYAPEASLQSTAYTKDFVGKYLSFKTFEVLSEGVEFDLARLKTLNVQVVDISSIVNYADIISFVAVEGLYRISIENIRFVLEHVVRWPDVDDLEKRHFSTVLEANDDALLKRISSDFDAYMREVLLALESNTSESVSAIIDLLNRDDVNTELKKRFLERQAATFPSFDHVPDVFHPLLLEKRMIESTWENCMAFLSSNTDTPELLTAYLQGADTLAILSRKPVPNGKDALALRSYLIGNDNLEIGVYRAYIRQLPNHFKGFAAVDTAKIRVLIEERKVEFSSGNFQQLEEQDLRVLFLALNFEAYLIDKERYVIDDEIRGMLLSSQITESQKLKVIADIDPAFVVSNASVASAIGPILDRSAIQKTDYGAEFVRSVILNSRSKGVQISLLNKLHGVLSDVQVRDVLRSLPEPYCDIATFGKSPKLANDDGNTQLASWLKARNLISSFASTILGDGIRINTFKKEA